jgi:hypothetical protein
MQLGHIPSRRRPIALSHGGADFEAGEQLDENDKAIMDEKRARIAGASVISTPMLKRMAPPIDGEVCRH